MGRELPRGTVTFLFTDVEGSTRLLHELGAERYAEALAEHRRVIREACSAESGVEVDTQGDAFFFAFPTAPGALSAAAAFTDTLAAGPIRVRTGIHTGTPFLAEEGYVGEDVHRAARIAAAGHGGQVLVSASTAALAGTDGHRDLGQHRLKDLSAPERIYQLGDSEFPPLATLYRTNLPVPATPFVGREQELAEVVDLLLRDDVRLLSLTGPGGTGKTRLALQAAAEASESYPDGVYWVPLAPLRDASLVLSTLAQALAVTEEGDRELEETLASYLAGKRLLLVLDNVEHLLPEAAGPIAALRDANGSRVLLTSRERLRIAGEQTWPVPPLEHADGAALFAARARAVDPAFTSTPAVGELCSRLDELPLAIELAAARTAVFSSEQLLDRLSGRLDLLKGDRDADPRQQTLRATIEWSHELLSEQEQQLFRRLAVFVGGCTYEAAEEVADADPDTLQSLLDKSLLRRRDGAGGPRYWMLETIREFARERLEAGPEAAEIIALHALRYARLAFDLYPSLRDYSSQTLRILREEQENMRAALDFALGHDDAPLAGDLVYGLWFYWLTMGSGTEARGWAERYLATPRGELPPLDRYLGDLGAAEIFRFTGEPTIATRLKHELVQTGRSNPETTLRGVPVLRTTAATLSDLSYIELDAGNVTKARALAEEALELRRRLGHPSGIAHASLALASIAYYERDWDGALELYLQSARDFEAAGVPADASATSISVAECQLLLGRRDEAAALLSTVLPRIRQLGDQTFGVYALRVAGMIAAARGEAESSALLFGAADSKLTESGLSYFGIREEEVYVNHVERVRRELGDGRFKLTCERGASLSDDELFELAVVSTV